MTEINETVTSREALEVTLEGVATGVIQVGNIPKGDLRALDKMVMELSGPQDGSLNRGDRLLFGNGCEAEIIAVGKVVTDDHVDYHVKLTTSSYTG